MTKLLCQAQLPVAEVPLVGTIWKLICDRPATGIWRGACVHEHVVERVFCDVHRPEPGDVGCRQCFDLGHECEMRAELVEALT